MLQYFLNENIAITTDIIVGFPTETEEDFSKTLDLVRRARFDAAFTFMYSKRRNTKAATFDGQVDRAEMGRRFDMLSDLLKDISFEKNKKFVSLFVFFDFTPPPDDLFEPLPEEPWYMSPMA